MGVAPGDVQVGLDEVERDDQGGTEDDARDDNDFSRADSVATGFRGSRIRSAIAAGFRAFGIVADQTPPPIQMCVGRSHRNRTTR